MNILAIDYGEKRIGLAWADTELGFVLPYGRVETSKWQEKIPLVIREEKIDRVVVGLPIGLDGTQQLNTKRVQAFITELAEMVSVPVLSFDERFTSQAADRMGKTGASRDEKAAMVLLEGYVKIVLQSQHIF